ncbi:MAG TPA: hypothetical protein VFV67_34135 [Actinophytocola sp.]|uniref:hypothetical protein n=1 Tax=Actinophytocola sp. TaxID=1872138 RepID=UPI002DBDADF7|nr:hypothetical protein [Actinophytocola sp.]HEU5475708.1 hypothetical protein [Actinophytocola sp.]
MGFVAEYETAGWFTVDTASVSVTCAEGDVLVANAVCGNQLRSLGISGGGLTWTVHGVVSALARCSTAQWTAIVGPGQGGTFNVTATFSAGGAGGLSVLRFDGIGSVGADAVGNAPDPTAPSLVITTTEDDSIVVVMVGDHETVDGVTRTWRTGAGALTETTYFRSNSENAAYVGYHANAGAAGAKTVGLTAPATMRPSIAAVELVLEPDSVEQPIGPASQTDTAMPMGRAKTTALGVAAATGSAQPLGRHKARALGTVVEVASAVPLSQSGGTAHDIDLAAVLAPQQPALVAIGAGRWSASLETL